MPENYVPLAPYLPKPAPVQPVKPISNILEPIERANIARGGYTIRVNYTPAVGEYILFKAGPAWINITGGYGKKQMPALLNSFAWKNSWAETTKTSINCRAIVVKPCGDYPVPGATYLQVMVPGMKTPFGQYFQILQESNEMPLQVPVLPIMRPLGWGAAALVPIGLAQPRLTWGYPGRLLSQDIEGRTYVLHMEQFEIDPNKRFLDCTTYIMACYRRRFSIGGDGKKMCEGLGLSLATGADQNGRISGSATRDYLTGNRGSYVVLKWPTLDADSTGHSMGYTRGMLHEFNVGPRGYAAISVNDKIHDELYYSIYTMP